MHKISISKKEERIFNLVRTVAEELCIDTYAVGGFVRDKILERQSKDIDFVCIGDGTLVAEQIVSRMNPSPKLTIFKRFGTAMFRFGNYDLEFVGARKESYTSDSRNPIVAVGSFEDDQRRRDFTINAMSVKINGGDYSNIVDPFNGLEDLAHGIIRTPLNPDQTYSDDPLRMMRAIRFATQLKFDIESKSLASIQKNKDRIKIVAKERIIEELNKIVLSKKPSYGFKLLFDTGLLEIIFKEMANLHGVEYVKDRGHKDNFYHTIEVLDNLAEHTDDLMLRWAAIMHDIAKPATKRYDERVGWTFHGHEVVGAAMVPKIFKRLGLPLDVKMKYVQKLVRLHLRPISLTNENITDSAIRRLLFDAGEDIDDLMKLCHADITSKNAKKVERYRSNYILVKEKLEQVEEKDKIRNWQPPISGEIIMNTFKIKPSREVGIIKTAIREAILDGNIANKYEDAFAFMLKKGEELGLDSLD